jgi:hypothetical protein
MVSNRPWVWQIEKSAATTQFSDTLPRSGNGSPSCALDRITIATSFITRHRDIGTLRHVPLSFRAPFFYIALSQGTADAYETEILQCGESHRTSR